MTGMTINGQAMAFRLDPHTPLLWALREAANLTGTKYGCDSRDCWACTVIVDGRAERACAVPIGTLDGAEVVTIEGLSSDGSHPVQRAWAAEQVSQCGFCDPGFIMAIAALLKGSPRPSADEVAAIPNLCPCGATPRIRRAIERAAQGPIEAAPAAAPGASAGPSALPLVTAPPTADEG